MALHVSLPMSQSFCLSVCLCLCLFMSLCRCLSCSVYLYVCAYGSSCFLADVSVILFVCMSVLTSLHVSLPMPQSFCLFICLRSWRHGLLPGQPQTDRKQSPVETTSCHVAFKYIHSTFSQTQKDGINGINATSVFPHSCSFLHYLYLRCQLIKLVAF